jgi:hypothetical protein
MPGGGVKRGVSGGVALDEALEGQGLARQAGQRAGAGGGMQVDQVHPESKQWQRALGNHANRK